MIHPVHNLSSVDPVSFLALDWEAWLVICMAGARIGLCILSKKKLRSSYTLTISKHTKHFFANCGDHYCLILVKIIPSEAEDRVTKMVSGLHRITDIGKILQDLQQVEQHQVGR